MKYLLIFPVILFTFISCNKLDIAEGTPKCVEKEIKEFEKNGPMCDDGEVSEYLFQGRKTYVLSPGSCGADMAAKVVDADCNTLGHLGGISGNTEINGEEFSEATFIRTVWEN